MTPRDAHERKSGQAMVEFVIGLVVVIVIIAAMLQVGSLSMQHNNAMIEAREEAAESAMSTLGLMDNADFISEVTIGNDESTYTRDDEKEMAIPSDISNRILTHADPDGLSQIMPLNPVSAMDSAPLPQAAFGLVRGYESKEVELLPAVQHLLYDRPSIDVEGEVWMIWTTGYY
jgi:hypothetical protein